MLLATLTTIEDGGFSPIAGDGDKERNVSPMDQVTKKTKGENGMENKVLISETFSARSCRRPRRV